MITVFLTKILTWKFLLLFLSAAFKFLFFVPAAIQALDLNFVESLVFSQTSGMFGVAFTLYLSKYIFAAFDVVKRKLMGKRHMPKKKAKLFTTRNRRIVKIKKGYGLLGISLITPTILSIPVGTLIAAKIYSHKRGQVYLYMSASVAVWSLIFSAILTAF